MAPRTLVLPLTAAAAATVAYALWRLRPRRGAGPPTPSTIEEYRCTCGQAFRVTGSGRHRVFWPDDAPQNEPVLSDRCPRCDRPLPAEAAA